MVEEAHCCGLWATFLYRCNFSFRWAIYAFNCSQGPLEVEHERPGSEIVIGSQEKNLRYSESDREEVWLKAG